MRLALLSVDTAGTAALSLHEMADGGTTAQAPLADAPVALSAIQGESGDELVALLGRSDGSARVQRIDVNGNPLVGADTLAPELTPRMLAAGAESYAALGAGADGLGVLEVRNTLSGALLSTFRMDVPATFDAGLGTLVGLAVEPSTRSLFVFPEDGDSIYELSASGAVLNSFARPGSSSDSFDLDFTTAPIDIAGTEVPAGTLLAFNGIDVPSTLHALDPRTGTVLAQLDLPSIEPVGGAHVPGADAVVTVEWTGEDTVLTIDTRDGSTLASTTPGEGFDVQYGDVDVEAATGHLLLVSSAQNMLRRLTPDGTVLGDIDLSPLGIANISGLAIDDARGQIWLGSAGGTLHRIRLADLAPDADADGVIDMADNCTAHGNPDQRDSDADGFGNACDADLDDNCAVDFDDLSAMKAVFFAADPDADLNGDGSVHFDDLSIMKALFFAPPGPSALPNACDATNQAQ